MLRSLIRRRSSVRRSIIYLSYRSFILPTAALKRTWRSPIYSFFQHDVTVQLHHGRLCHFFKCAARHCKTKTGGVHRFQDSKDRSSTANLRHHAINCFGEEAVATATSAVAPKGINQSIFSMFAHQGQKSIQYSHRSHTNIEVRYVSTYYLSDNVFISICSARLVKWVTESNRPTSIVKDRELEQLLTAGRPHISLPSDVTVTRDVNACFKKCGERVRKLLKVSHTTWTRFINTNYPHPSGSSGTP